jgi:aminoglycoside/choline kinase family phosphotransferase
MTANTLADPRLDLLTRWVGEELKLTGAHIAPASADASFRRYFRVLHAGQSYIVMDAPPGKEDLQPFLRVAQMLLEVGVNVPTILARDLARGFLLLSDLGSASYLDALQAASAAGDEERIETLYGDALESLVKIQVRGAEAALPPYDRAALIREMALMPEWFFDRHLSLKLEPSEVSMLEGLQNLLVQSAAEQPASLVHRDYHSRNLMVCDRGNPGILDFQDALQGPITYDLVSLLKDCYIRWPASQVQSWALQYRQRLIKARIPAGRDDAQFLQWFDWMGLQRHIKVLGIFARLWYRDGKRGYLKDLPLVLDYVRETAQRYPQTAPFASFIASRVDARFAQAQRRESA